MGTYDEGFRASVTGPVPLTPRSVLAGHRGSDRLVDEPTGALDSRTRSFYRWLPDGELDVTHTDLDRHVESSRGEQAVVKSDP